MMEETQSCLQQKSVSENGPAEEKQKITLTSDLVAKELQKEKNKSSFKRGLQSTVGILIVVAAVVVLIAVFLCPVLQISGDSMTETLNDGDIVVALNGKQFETGDVIAFYYGNDILLKRVIASAGQWVDMDAEGNVYVDNELLDEPYVTGRSLGECSIQFPYQVPDGRMFVLGDHRTVSVDSRNQAVGCVEGDSVIGKVMFRVWPLSDLGLVK